MLQLLVVSSCDAHSVRHFCRQCVKIKCPKTMMRTNRGPVSPCRREGCRPEGCAASSLPCAGLSTTAECRGEPLPGAPVTAQRVACCCTQFGWNRGTQLSLSKALHPVEHIRGEASFLSYPNAFFISKRSNIMKIIYKDGHVDECPQDHELHVIRHTAAHVMAQASARGRMKGLMGRFSLTILRISFSMLARSSSLSFWSPRSTS